MKQFESNNLGQIKEANITFGDFTVFIGPQASGKSILLQMFKLALDGGHILAQMKNHGVQHKGNPNEFLELYMGEGMGKILRQDTEIRVDGAVSEVHDFIQEKGTQHERVAYVPAQRVLAMHHGWPRPYSDFRLKDPFVLKKFSSGLQHWLDLGLDQTSGDVFPATGLMHAEIEEHIRKAIFVNASVKLDKSTPQMRLMLDTGESQISYLGWSAGQREFTPLLLQLYGLLQNGPSPNGKLQHHQYVIIEEPEMGLHPMAIEALMLLFLELMSRGYNVIVSTHSSTILQLCWTVRLMQQMKAKPEELRKLFSLGQISDSLHAIFEHTLNRAAFYTYFFDRKSDEVTVRDISALEQTDEDPDLAEWGGMTAFGSKASELISNLMASRDAF